MIGFAIFMARVQKDSIVDAYNPKVGYSQALDIVAWVLCLILAGLSFVLIKSE